MNSLLFLFVDSPRHKSLFDRPPTRSGNGKSETPEKEIDQAQKPAQTAPVSKPGTWAGSLFYF